MNRISMQENVTKTILSEDTVFSILGELCRLPDPEEKNGVSERNGTIRQLGWSHEALRADNVRLREALEYYARQPMGLGDLARVVLAGSGS